MQCVTGIARDVKPRIHFTIEAQHGVAIVKYQGLGAEGVALHVQHSTVAAYTLHLTDLGGKLVYTARHAGVSGRINLPMQSYPAGTYLLTLSAEDATSLGSYRIVRQ